MTKWLLIFLSTCISYSAQSQWYETQGVAYINGQDTKVAKTKAMENALKKALLVAGASVSSVQQVVNGLLTQDEISIRASGTVNSFELVDETYTDEVVNVTIRADIFPKEKQCFSADYKKTLLLTRSNLLHREQASIGEIYNLDSVVMKKLSAKINHEGQYLDTVLALKNKTNFSRLNSSIQAEGIKRLSMSLSEFSDTQYVMFSEIHDLSFANSLNNEWQFWQNDIYNRNFDMELYIYNGANGELVFNKQYRNSAPWTYNKRSHVDINGMAFWQSSYGNIINQTLNDVITDIDEAMMCQATRGKIVQVANNQITINLGKKHGVQVGDEFSLLHLNNFVNNQGKTYAGYNVSNFTVKVTQVSEQSAHATTENGDVFDNIQLNDLAVKN